MVQLRYIAAIALTATLIGAAFSPKIERSAVIGRYVANHGKGLDVIDLRVDGTYAYIFRPVRGGEIRNAGRWTFYRQGNTSRVTFRDFIFGLSDYGEEATGSKNTRYHIQLGRSFRKLFVERRE